MKVATVQKCPICEKVYRHGQWVDLTTNENKGQLAALNAAIFAGSVQILEASCINCEEEGLDGLGHAGKKVGKFMKRANHKNWTTAHRPI